MNAARLGSTPSTRSRVAGCGEAELAASEQRASTPVVLIMTKIDRSLIRSAETLIQLKP